MVRLLYSAEARKRIRRLDSGIRHQLEKALERIAKDPSIGKRLTHELSEFISYRSGDYRIIYRFSQGESSVIIMSVGHRREVYKKVKWRTVQ